MLAHQAPIPPRWSFKSPFLSYLLFLLFSILTSAGTFGLSWSTAPVLALPSACPILSGRSYPGSSRWQERTSCLTCSPLGLSRNGCAWYPEGNCCLATGPPLSSAFLADMPEQTTQPPKSGGLTGGGLHPIDQNQRQQHSALAKEFSAKMIKYCTSHPEHVPTEFLVLSVSVRWQTKTHL